jgi:hypothetical protein
MLGKRCHIGHHRRSTIELRCLKVSLKQKQEEDHRTLTVQKKVGKADASLEDEIFI